MDQKKDLPSTTEELERKIKEDAYPSNSHSRRDTSEPKTEKKIEKVVTGNVVTKKKTFSKKVAEFFIGEDVANVKSYILYDVLIPAAKNTFLDMLSSGAEMLFFGETRRGSRTVRDKGRSYINYTPYDKQFRPERDRRDTTNAGVGRPRHDSNEIILETRGEAEIVLSRLVDLIDDYGLVSVADLYELVGVPSNYMDNKWGWENLSTARVERVRNGYLIVLPKVNPID